VVGPFAASPNHQEAMGTGGDRMMRRLPLPVKSPQPVNDFEAVAVGGGSR
jgi:hypothetical protein